MRLKDRIQHEANIGYWYKRCADEAKAKRNAAEEARRAEEHKALTDAAHQILASAPTRMQGSAQRGEATCHLHTIPESDIDFPREYFDGQPLEPSTLKGVSRRLFEILQEEDLNPLIKIPRRRTFDIEIPVLPQTDSPPWKSRSWD